MLKEFLPIISSVALVIGGVAAFVWGLISGFRKRTQLAEGRVDKAQAELGEVLKLEAGAWKNRYEGEHQEFAEYRQKAHDKANEDGAKILKLTADCAELQSKTDLTPILAFQNDQTKINAKMIETLDKILLRLDALPQ
jgi:outer membrane protein OmpA-like peptidoglycan-associated protein